MEVYIPFYTFTPSNTYKNSSKSIKTNLKMLQTTITCKFTGYAQQYQFIQLTTNKS